MSGTLNEDKLESMMMQNAMKHNTPINGSVELLPLCNMNCDMCYVRLSNQEVKEQGGLRTCEEWIKVGEQMKEAGVLFLLLTGGEPLLFPNFKKLYVAYRKMGFILTINTNGTLIDEEWVAFFKENPPRRINITLYGESPNAYHSLCHYEAGFHKVLHAVRLLREANIDVKLASSITKCNVNDIDGLVKVADDLDVPMRCDTYMMPAIRERNKPFDEQSRLTPEDAAKAYMKALKLEMTPDIFRQYIEKCIFEVEHILPSEGPNKMKCFAGACSFTINWQGNMRPCVILGRPEMSVLEHGFQAAWDYIRTECKKITLSSKCLSCRYRTICKTCAASELFEEGEYGKSPRYMCQYSKTLYACILEESRLLEEQKGNIE